MILLGQTEMRILMSKALKASVVRKVVFPLSALGLALDCERVRNRILYRSVRYCIAIVPCGSPGFCSTISAGCGVREQTNKQGSNIYFDFMQSQDRAPLT